LRSNQVVEKSKLILLPVAAKRTDICIRPLQSIVSKERSDHESNCCTAAHSGDDFCVAWNVMAFLSERRDAITALPIPGDTDCDTYSLTASIAERYPNAGA
jgi:hypothetical protein